jgi:hypothetical protein
MAPVQAGSEQVVERLWPGPWFWALGVAGAVALGIAYGVALTPLVGWLVAALATVGVVVLGMRLAARIAVGPDGLSAGRARLPWDCAGRVIALDGEGTRMALGPQGDPSAWMLLRPGVGPGAVVVEVTDPQDPHRTWLVATRDPQRLSRAIAAARGRLAP